MGIYEVEIKGQMYVPGNSKNDKEIKKLVEDSFKEHSTLKLFNKKARITDDLAKGECEITPRKEIPEKELNANLKRVHGIIWED